MISCFRLEIGVVVQFVMCSKPIRVTDSCDAQQRVGIWSIDTVCSQQQDVLSLGLSMTFEIILSFCCRLQSACHAPAVVIQRRVVV